MPVISKKSNRTRLIGSIAAGLLSMAVSAPASAGPNQIFVGGGGGNYNFNRGKSLHEMRFKDVVRQRYDFSCGSAAIATLLSYHYGHSVEEMDVLQAMFARGDQEKIRKEGFSLLDMREYLNSAGYRAEGFRESLDKLSQVGIPAIVLINKRGYLHFVVVKGVSAEKVIVGDPTLGVRIYSRKDFEKMWNGILFVLMDNKDTAKSTFNSRALWASHGNPRFRHMLENGELASLTMSIAAIPNIY